jgi:hypothetical protein
MGRFERYVAQVRQSRLLAPNLREASLVMYTGMSDSGNQVAR